MNRFFVDCELVVGDVLTLPDDVAHHWGKVLRARVSDNAVLFNGQGGEYAVTLTHIDKKSAQVTINNYNPNNKDAPFKVTLGQVMSRGERMDYAIQKAIEMGVHQIQLLTSEHCQEHLKYERDKKKLTHWQAVAVAACEQCGLNIVPQFLPPIDVRDWVPQCTSILKLIMAVSDGDYQPTHLPQDIALLVGPEGGLSQDEIDLAIDHGFHAWTIGERVLRTETAPVVALSALQTIWALSR